jgi:hypothetical protein
MYVAYNPYYPPDLAHNEARNASHDRSHNEAFDALVTNRRGGGYLIYMFFFASIFLLWHQWLGLIRSLVKFRLFAAMVVMGALLGVIVLWTVDHSLRFIGRGLPVGFLVGIALYMALLCSQLVGQRARGRGKPATRRGDTQPSVGGARLAARKLKLIRPTRSYRNVLLYPLVAAIVAHFAEDSSRHRTSGGHAHLFLGVCGAVVGGGAGADRRAPGCPSRRRASAHPSRARARPATRGRSALARGATTRARRRARRRGPIPSYRRIAWTAN